MKKNYITGLLIWFWYNFPRQLLFLVFIMAQPVLADKANKPAGLTKVNPTAKLRLFSVFKINNTAGFTQTNFSVINWGTAASQLYTVSEAHGKVVNGKLYTFGGFDSQKSGFTPTSRAYGYDPLLNQWTALAPMPAMNNTSYGGVTHAGLTTDGQDIYFAGGYTANAAGTGQIFGSKEVWKYIIAENRYVRLPDLPATLAAGQLEYLNGKLHHIGGTNAARTQDLGTHYVLDLNNLNAGWKTLAPLPNPRHHAGSAVLGSKIYLIGGQRGHDAKLVTQKEVHRYDPATDTWTKMADLPVPAGASGRGHISSAVVVANDRLLVLGGEIKHGTSTNMVSAYSPATNTWEDLTPLPANRFSGVAGWLTDQVFYTGGSFSKTTYKGEPEGLLVSTPDALPVTGRRLVQIFPNPGRGKEVQLMLENFDKKEKVKVYLYDASGKLINASTVITNEKGSGNQVIATDFLQNGLYLLKTSAASGETATKLLIDK